MALDQQYRKMLRDLMLESDSLSGRQTLSDGSIIGYDANTPEDMIASVANPPQPMLEIQQQQVEQPQTPQRISDLLVRQRPQDFGDQQRFDEAYQFKQQMPEGQSYLRNNTTGAVQTLPSFVRQPAMQQQPQEPSPKQIIDDLMYYAKGKSIPSDQLGKMIQYQATKAQGAPSAQDLYHEASGRGIPIETLISAYLTIGGANSAREKENLALQKQRAELAQLQAKPEQGTWSAVESNGKQYLINNKTGAIKPAEVGGEQLQGKKGDGAKLKEEGAADVNVYIAALRDAYNRLDSGGGITNTDKGWVDNSIAGIASSGVGQATGKVFGTQNQSARNDIAMTRPALLAALMKSTGMSAKQMDSNVELKLWLSTATDPTLDVQSNRRALDKIEMKYLGGDKIGDTKPTEPKQPSQEIVERSTSKSGKPIVKRKGSKDWEYE